MLEKGESSSAKPSSLDESKPWAKLVPTDSRYPDVQLTLNDMAVTSETAPSSIEKCEWCKITRNTDLVSATIENKSSNAILVDGVAVQSAESKAISGGSEIIPGPNREGYLIYGFEIMPTPKSHDMRLKISIDIEHAKCSICLNIWHDVVTVAPCLHNFCNGCFSEWLRRSQERRAVILCPQCRGMVQFVGKNHFLSNIVEDILQANSSLRRSDEEISILNSYASIQSNLVIGSGKKRRRTALMEEGDDLNANLPCPQCGTAYGGFRCCENTVHVQCHACGGMMPSRSDINVPQHCLGCDRAFCGAYWHAQGVMRADNHPICGYESFKPIRGRSISSMPLNVHENNRHEQDMTERCIRQMGRTLEEVISDWIAKFNNREIDRIRLALNNPETLTAATYVCKLSALGISPSCNLLIYNLSYCSDRSAYLCDKCSGCFDKLVSFLLYWFRITMPKHCLPPEAAKREDCWYGYGCRTQHHNEEHARKRNHVCRPTRGSLT